jgi:hypothetical protein
MLSILIKSAAIIIILNLSLPVSAEETFTESREQDLSMKGEALEWGIYTSLFAGGTVGILSAGAGFFHQNFYSGNKNRSAIVIMPIATDDGLYLTSSMNF